MEKPYHTIDRKDTQALAHFLSRNGQGLLPMVELIEQSEIAVDELIDVLGRAMIEVVLRLSAEQIAGPPHPGKKGGAVSWHGRERGTIALKERKLRVAKPRLRRKGQGDGGEVPIPAYEAMRGEEKLGSRMLEILLRGVSTRKWKRHPPHSRKRCSELPKEPPGRAQSRQSGPDGIHAAGCFASSSECFCSSVG